MSIGWIKLHRVLKDWEWYSDIKATRLLTHLLISVNYEDKKWMGQTIKAGSLAYSWENLALSIGLTIQQTRTAMSKLESSGEVTRKTTNKYQVVTLCKWEKMQGDNKQVTDKPTSKQQTDNKPITTTKEVKEYKEDKKKELSSLQEPKTNIFNQWLNYRKEVKKEIKVSSTIEKLVNKFNSESISKCNWVVNNSIENGYQGLFWDNYKEEKNEVKKNLRVPNRFNE